MQLKPTVAEYVAKKQGLGPMDLTDPRENILSGMSYLKYLKEKLGGMKPAVEAYNVGPGAYRKGKRNPDYVRAVLTRGMR
jgi:soluble lytic murein transglycosylase-like protein